MELCKIVWEILCWLQSISYKQSCRREGDVYTTLSQVPQSFMETQMDTLKSKDKYIFYFDLGGTDR